MFRRAPRVRPLRPANTGAALELALRDPAVNALGGARLHDLSGALTIGREFSSFGPDTEPEGVLWHGVNISAMQASPRALAAFGAHLAERGRRASSIVGERTAVEALWRHLEPEWGRDVREHRWSQPLLVAEGEPPRAMRGAGLRVAEDPDADRVFPAAVAMFREEVGVDPLVGDGGRGFRRRVDELIRQRRTYVVTDGGDVVFKADVGALFGQVAQIHGVWVRPGCRGQGLGRRAMVELVEAVRSEHAPVVALYVNDFNEPARRAYAAAGFRQTRELATILF